MYFLLLYFVLFLQCICFGICEKDTLQFVTLFFRHGQRTPTSFYTFPTDPPGTGQKLKIEQGELTQIGKQQIYMLGQNLKKEYGDFIGKEYRPSELRIYSGVDNRTVASAQLMLAGFLPPVEEQIWNSDLLWQPIPVHTESTIDDVSFGVMDNCPSLNNTIYNSKEFTHMFIKYSNITNYLEEKTGMKIPNLYILQKVIDVFLCRDFLGPELPLPKWADSQEFINYLRPLLYKMHIEFINQFLRDSTGAWHMDQILSGMENSINNRTKHKMIIFSGHDTNIMTINEYLGLNLNESPNFGSYLAFEVFKNNQNEYYIKVLWHPEINGSTIQLFIENCNFPCTYEKFSNLKARLSKQQWLDIYKNDKRNAKPVSFYGTIAAGLILLTILLICAVIMLLWACLTYKKRYEHLTNYERTHLLG